MWLLKKASVNKYVKPLDMAKCKMQNGSVRRKKAGWPPGLYAVKCDCIRHGAKVVYQIAIFSLRSWVRRFPKLIFDKL